MWKYVVSATIVGLIQTAGIPALLGECSHGSSTGLCGESYIVGQSVAYLKDGHIDEFEKHIYDNKLIEHARNQPGNVFYNLVRMRTFVFKLGALA